MGTETSAAAPITEKEGAQWTAAKVGGERILRSFGLTRISLLICVIAALLPVWAVSRFPSVDGPVHLYIVFVLDQLAQPGVDVFERVFARNHHLEPNLAVYGILWLLSRVFPMLVAEKLFVSGYFLLFAGSAYYLMSSFRRQSASLCLLMLPFALGYFLHWGFYNFVLSQALFLLAAGYAVRHQERLGWPQLAILSVLMLGLALTHLVGVAMFLLFIGLFRAGIALREVLTSTSERRWAEPIRSLAKDALRLLLAALPALAIVASFLIRRVLSDADPAPVLSLVKKIWYVASISPIFSVDKREAIALAPFTLVFWALALKLSIDLSRDKQLRLAALPVLLPAAFLAMAVTLGSLGFAGFDALPRLLPFAFFILIMAFGTLRLNKLWQGAIFASVVGGLIATSAMHLVFYRQVNALYDIFAASRPPPPPGSAIVAFNVTTSKRQVGGYSTGWRMNVTDHFRETYARENKLVMLNIIQLAPQIYGYFPVSYAPSSTLSAAYKADMFRAPALPLLAFEQSVRIPVREVSFWPEIIGEPEVKWAKEERKILVRRELARDWKLLPRTSSMAPFVYVKRNAPAEPLQQTGPEQNRSSAHP